MGGDSVAYVAGRLYCIYQFFGLCIAVVDSQLQPPAAVSGS
jgi:hypothetical protein